MHQHASSAICLANLECIESRLSASELLYCVLNIVFILDSHSYGRGMV